MSRFVGIAFLGFVIVLSASILGGWTTLLYFTEWNGFFVRSALGAFVMVLILGAVEMIGAAKS